MLHKESLTIFFYMKYLHLLPKEKGNQIYNPHKIFFLENINVNIYTHTLSIENCLREKTSLAFNFLLIQMIKFFYINLSLNVDIRILHKMLMGFEGMSEIFLS